LAEGVTRALARLSPQAERQVRRKRHRHRLSEPEFHRSVYVVLLSKAALKDLSILRHNLKRDPSKPAVYVGMTGLPVDHRFENHKNGYKSARLVRKHGVRLLPELFEHLNPMPYEHAVQMEKDLADDLRAQGYAVCGGT
jgi:predicted GIY-YIG superfamily endonuclease